MEQAKRIIATFLKIQPENITVDTAIDKRAIQGSILIHRMYSALAEAGFRINNRNEIHTFGDFVTALGNQGIEVESVRNNYDAEIKDSNDKHFCVGIDIENINSFPIAEDYRENEFYKMNFSQQEISYCLLQKDPRISFAGKFSAKEALIKADNSLINIPFYKLEILNNNEGRPIFNNFSLSVSHTSEYAIAFAVRLNFLESNNMLTHNATEIIKNEPQSPVKKSNGIYKTNLFSILALLFSAVALILSLYTKIH